MSGVLRKQGEPDAVFVIERKPGVGYTITNQHGPESDRLKTAAVGLLDDIGQPDPTGSNEFHQWLEPIPPTGHFVGVTVHLLDTGETRFHQSWFQIRKRRDVRVQLVLSLAVLCLLVGAIGGAVGYHVWKSDRPGDSDEAETATPSEHDNTVPRDPQEREDGKLVSTSEPEVEELRARLRESRDLRHSLAEFLGQEGLAKGEDQDVFDPDETVAIENRSDRNVEKREVKWNPLDVRKMLNLLEAIREFENVQRASEETGS